MPLPWQAVDPEAVIAEPVIDCIDCGGQAHLLTLPPEFGWQPGDLVVYRCEDCLDRWDLIIPEDE
jgi:hypothetical protein